MNSPDVITSSRFLAQHATEGEAMRVVSRPFSGSLLSGLRWAWESRNAKVIHVDTDMRLLTCVGLIRRLPLRRPRLIVQDIILRIPRSAGAKLRVGLLGHAVRTADLVVLHQADSAALRHLLRLPAEKVRVVPFKINEWSDDHAPGPILDGDGTVLLAGQTYRDFDTFLRALTLQPELRATWLKPSTAMLKAHGSDEPTVPIPPNVRVVNSDGTRAGFLSALAQCSAVALPIPDGTLTAAGISTLLDAMWLGKPVIISDCPAVRGMVPEHAIVTVPPGNPSQLGNEMARLLNDQDHRAMIIAGGKQYAMQVRGESRLAGDLLRFVSALIS